MDFPVPSRDRRGVSPVIGVVLMLAITVLLAATVGGFVLSETAALDDPTPTVARSTGSFTTGPSGGCGENTVAIRHAGGDSVPADEIEIAVRLPDTDTRARLVDLPVSGTALSAANTDDPDNVVYDYCVGGVIADGGQPWSAGRMIAFQLNAGGGTVEPGDTIDVRVVHAPSNGVLAAVELTARR
ncbi:type IV pilin N-terminal domain-containing protein [Haloarcula sp. S1AR25-5A]|uniref:Type IV pilin N-terminal domain-containing protein n=1 Tax=Haloarcula terrestris TaxID=2950533 RepID=A0AAE4EV67_9EURY|nr:type IV pilin N-terminal domain-containing protein [Haloarcula terrestris]MDS0220765.1 type IV pilin N-terminal domain-containing protein [Haloarcula terrestris]